MELKEYPRVLVVTVNPFSNTSNNGKTYASFFKGYPKESLAQLYFHREIPTSDVCDNYFKISDEDVINGLIKKSKKIGSQVFMEDKEERFIPETVNNRLKKLPIIRYLRSLVWSFLDFEKTGVIKWLDDFKPEVIFFCGGDANYLYKKVIKLSQRYNTRNVYYITDDYVLPYFSFDPFYLLNRLWTRRVFINMCKNSDLILTIGDKMTRVYKEKFGIESEKIMNLVKVKDNDQEEFEHKTNNLKFVYTGGLHSNRWKSLSLLGKSLERLSKEGIQSTLEIYSQSKPEEDVLNLLNNGEYSKFCGALDENGVKTVLSESDILIHVESFDNNSKKVTLLSISTKIPEYMATGKCIVAVGPEDVASIEYLKETNSGSVITTTKSYEIDNLLREIITSPGKRKEYAKNALNTLYENHDSTKERNRFQRKISSL